MKDHLLATATIMGGVLGNVLAEVAGVLVVVESGGLRAPGGVRGGFVSREAAVSDGYCEWC